MAELAYEYLIVADRSCDPVVGIDSYTKKFLTDEMNKKRGKGWHYEDTVPLSALVMGETQPQGFGYLFKRTQPQPTPEEKGKRTRKK